MLFSAQDTHAATILVGADCSLNNAIRSANENESIGGCSAGEESATDYIIINGTYELNENPVTVTSDIFVIGNNSPALDGRGRYSFFRVGDGGSLRVQGLPMTDGRGSSSRGQIYLAGGASLQFNNSPIKDCSGTPAIVGSSNATLIADSQSTVCGEEAVIVARDLPVEASAGPSKS